MQKRLPQAILGEAGKRVDLGEEGEAVVVHSAPTPR
jgi:hypothetical protein